MNKSKLKIIGIVVLVIVLPPVSFSIYEFSSFRSNEQKISKIYESQLNALLFSVKQNATDNIESAAKKIGSRISLKNSNFQISDSSIFQNFPYISHVFISDIELKDIQLHSRNNESAGSEFIKEQLFLNKAKIPNLISMVKEADYYQIMPIEIKASPTEILQMFIVNAGSDQFLLAGLVMNHKQFANEMLGPKIQSIAMEEFIISIIDTRDNSIVYNSGEIIKQKSKNSISSELWIIPFYSVTIQLKTTTINQLVQGRIRVNILMNLGIVVILLFGVWYFYRNVQKEIRLAQIKSDFISNVSHEIRTPLAMISMYIETLQLGRVRTEEKIKEYYQVIFQETQRLAGIVNKILNFSHIESGKRKYKFEQLDINNITENVVNSYQYHLKQKGFTSDFVKNESLNFIMADSEALTDAIINLIDNAVKYSNDKKHIIITTGQNDKFVYVEVKDFGIGIRPEDQKYIFDKFYRVTKGDLAYKARGSGLGLAIVKSFMDASNGKIELSSVLGQGSTFRLNFPKKFETLVFQS